MKEGVQAHQIPRLGHCKITSSLPKAVGRNKTPEIRMEITTNSAIKPLWWLIPCLEPGSHGVYKYTVFFRSVYFNIQISLRYLMGLVLQASANILRSSRFFKTGTPKRFFTATTVTMSDKLEYVRLGNSGLKISPIILGCMSYGSRRFNSSAREI